jgi:DNA-binding LytR/AlgR family response regulator
MIKAIAIDDDPMALKVIEHFCKRVEFIQLEKTFTKPDDAAKHLLKFPVDLLFLDIDMPGITGIELYKAIEQNSMVIFITAHSKYALDGFDLSAVDFIVKPFTYERFEVAVNKARDYYYYQSNKDLKDQQYIYVRVDYSLVKIALADILYIESLADYIHIYLVSQKRVTTRITMKAMEDKLSQKNFIRVHRSFILPIARIENVRNKIIHLQDKEIPIGRSYEKQAANLIK